MQEIGKLEKLIVASAIQSRATWENFSKLGVREDLSPEGQRVLDEVGTFYTRDESVGMAEFAIIESSILRQLTSPKHQELFASYMRALPTTISATNVLQEVSALKRFRTGQRLAAAIVSNKGQKDIDELIVEYNNFKLPETLLAKPASYRTAWDIQELMEKRFNKANMIKLAPKTLNDRVDGGMMRGDNIVVVGPTEIGKSLFVVNLEACFLAQGLKVGHFENEEPSERHNLRLISRLTEKTKSELYDPTKWEEIRETLARKGYSGYTVIDIAPGSVEEIDTIVQDLHLDVVVINQMRNLSSKAESRTNQLEQIATGIRNIGKARSVLPVSVTQAGASSFGKSMLNRGDIDSSNVGIPGQADLIIGINATEEQESQGIRCISISKNKSGNKTPFFCQFDTLLSKVTEV